MKNEMTPDLLVKIVKEYGYNISKKNADLLLKIDQFGDQYGEYFYIGDYYVDKKTDMDLWLANSNLKLKDGVLQNNGYKQLADLDIGNTTWEMQMAGKLNLYAVGNGDFWVWDLTSGGEYIDCISHELMGFDDKRFVKLSDLYEFLHKTLNDKDLRNNKIAVSGLFNKNDTKHSNFIKSQNELYEIIVSLRENIYESIIDNTYYQIPNEDVLKNKYPLPFLFTYKYLGLLDLFEKLRKSAKIEPYYQGVLNIIDETKPSKIISKVISTEDLEKKVNKIKSTGIFENIIKEIEVGYNEINSINEIFGIDLKNSFSFDELENYENSYIYFSDLVIKALLKNEVGFMVDSNSNDKSDIINKVKMLFQKININYLGLYKIQDENDKESVKYYYFFEFEGVRFCANVSGYSDTKSITNEFIVSEIINILNPALIRSTGYFLIGLTYYANRRDDHYQIILSKVKFDNFLALKENNTIKNLSLFSIDLNIVDLSRKLSVK